MLPPVQLASSQNSSSLRGVCFATLLYFAEDGACGWTHTNAVTHMQLMHLLHHSCDCIKPLALPINKIIAAALRDFMCGPQPSAGFFVLVVIVCLLFVCAGIYSCDVRQE